MSVNKRVSIDEPVSYPSGWGQSRSFTRDVLVNLVANLIAVALLYLGAVANPTAVRAAVFGLAGTLILYVAALVPLSLFWETFAVWKWHRRRRREAEITPTEARASAVSEGNGHTDATGDL